MEPKIYALRQKYANQGGWILSEKALMEKDNANSIFQANQQFMQPLNPQAYNIPVAPRMQVNTPVEFQRPMNLPKVPIAPSMLNLPQL